MNTPSNSSRERLGTILKQETSALERLVRTLETEYSAMTARDVETLAQSTKQKMAQLQELDSMGKEREAVLATMGCSQGHEGMKQFLDNNAATADIAALWTQLQTLAENCRAQNRTNHLLVDMGTNYTHQALRILRGEGPNQKLYDPNGNTPEDHDQRALALA